MSTIHRPERQPGESQTEYRARQRLSQDAVRAMRLVGVCGKQTGREAQRDSKRNAGKLRGVYGIGLLQPQRRSNEHRMAFLHRMRDENGAYTLIGRFEHGRRMWLAGISAQRGY